MRAVYYRIKFKKKKGHLFLFFVKRPIIDAVDEFAQNEQGHPKYTVCWFTVNIYYVPATKKKQ